MNTCMNQLCAFSVQVCVVLHDRLSKMLNGVQLYRRPARGGYGLRYPDPCMFEDDVTPYTVKHR